MTVLQLVRWIHVLAAATWGGGIIILFYLGIPIPPTDSRQKKERVLARKWAGISWVSLLIAIGTGFYMVFDADIPWTDAALASKLAMIAAAVVFATIHQFTARHAPVFVRSTLEALSLVLVIGIFGASAALIG